MTRKTNFMKVAAALAALAGEAHPARADTPDARILCIQDAYQWTLRAELKYENKGWLTVPDKPPFVTISADGQQATLRMRKNVPIPFMALSQKPISAFAVLYAQLHGWDKFGHRYGDFTDTTISLRSILVQVEGASAALSYNGVLAANGQAAEPQGPYHLTDAQYSDVHYAPDGQALWDKDQKWGNWLAAQIAACLIREDVQARYRTSPPQTLSQ